MRTALPILTLLCLCAGLQAQRPAPDVAFERPGVTADRQARRVVLDATATAVSAGDTAEFFLIAQGSGHDYEALAIAKARPSDIVAALRYIGMEPGAPCNQEQLRFWPKGERVIATFAFEDAEGTLRSLRVEDLITDKRTGQSLPREGFVFTGSQVQPAPDTGIPALLADLRDPMSIISNYNEPETLLDVPRQAPQGDLYEQQTVVADYPLREGQALRVMLTPEYTDGTRRVIDFALRITAPETPGEGILNGAVLTLSTPAKLLCRTNDLAAVLKHFAATVEQQKDPYVSVDFAGNLRLETIRNVCTLLGSLEGPNGVRVEPPGEGQLYYRAFTPREEYRSRKARYAQPSELILRLRDGACDAEAVHISQHWDDTHPDPRLETSRHPVSGPAALPDVLAKAEQMPILLVFADPALTLATLMSFVDPVLETHPTIHVYLGSPAD